MGKRTGPNCAGLLSLDLWGRVLSLAAPRSADDKRLGSFSPPQCFRDQAAFYQLRLVCKTFNQAFLDYPHLSRGLVVTPPLRDRTSLLRWLQRHHGSVRSFADYVGSPTVEFVLKALLQAPSALRTLFMYQCDPKGLTCLQGWGNLTTLAIVDPLDELNLSTLNILRLETISLHAGSYRCIHLPEHLSSLTLDGATLVCQPEGACLTSVKKLRVSFDSQLEGVHPNWVLGCCALEGLTCLESRIVVGRDAQSPADLCCTIPAQLPAEISALTNLASLRIAVATNPVMHISCFYGLHSLQDLNVYARGAHLFATDGLHALSRLTSLTLSAHDYLDGVSIVLDTCWDDLKLLKVLKIDCNSFDFCPSLFGLVSLPSLRFVSIDSSLPCEPQEVGIFAALTGLLAQNSNIGFRMNDASIQDIRAEYADEC